MKVVFLSALLLGAAMLHGCAFVPGQNVSTSKIFREDDATAGAVEIVPITRKLLAMDSATRDHTQVPQELLDYRPGPYHIGVGDTLYITVWEHPELTSPAGPQQVAAANGRAVRSDGTLFYPFAGVVKVDGMTVEQLRTLITQRLAPYVEDPQVDISIITYGSSRVVMEGAFVRTDAQVFDTAPLTLGRAMGAAVVNPDMANLSGLVLTRDGHDYHLNLDAMRRGGTSASDIYLKAGDRVFLPFNDRQEVYVVGEVLRPGPLKFKIDSLTLTQAIGQAGGLNQSTSKGKAVYVIRGMKDLDHDPASVYQLDARSPTAYALGDHFDVQPGDVVFVGAAGITRWNRLISQLLPLSGIISNAAAANYNVDRAQ
ncbi:polysaccharide biosynthesis/export family protein [Bacillus sp. NP157]|nr:polysaccharide biosynthesis/export family protein [Bacillus sp. NP157]